MSAMALSDAGGEAGGRHLIEQRLEEVVVTPIDHGDAYRRSSKSLGGLESRKPAAEDDHVGCRWGHGESSHVRRKE